MFVFALQCVFKGAIYRYRVHSYFVIVKHDDGLRVTNTKIHQIAGKHLFFCNKTIEILRIVANSNATQFGDKINQL